MTSNAREFLNEIADIIRAKGRTVTIEETQESFGTMAWLSAPAPHWYDTTITMSAAKSDRTGRWRMGDLTVRGGSSNTRIVTNNRTDARISVRVHA